MPDRVIGRYELLEKLASSATATVWRARDHRRRRDVALKIANAGTGEISGQRLLEAEADVGARLKHPNIIPVLDAHLGTDKTALAFPLVDGETLARRLAHDGRLAPADAAKIAEQIATALAHAHGRGVVHRDVKPANVMLGTDGNARLFDFGISATPERGGGAVVEPGMTTGTLPYMAPEQLAGHSAEPATDVYALGAVLYEMLSGRRPYQGATTEALAAEQQQPPIAIDDAPPKLAALAMEALDPDPLARPRASVLAARLRGWLAGSAEEETVVVPIAPPTAVVRATSAPSGTRLFAGPRLSGVAVLVASLVFIAAVAGALALSVANSRPAATDVPAVTTYPGVGASPWPTLVMSPTPAPAQVGSGGGGGGGSSGSGGGGGDHGGSGGGKSDQDGGNGKGKGH